MIRDNIQLIVKPQYILQDCLSSVLLTYLLTKTYHIKEWNYYSELLLLLFIVIIILIDFYYQPTDYSLTIKNWISFEINVNNCSSKKSAKE